MTDWKPEDLLFCIPKLKRYYFNKIQLELKPKIANKLAWTYTILTIFFIVVLFGALVFVGCKYKIPVLGNMGDVLGIKYLFAVHKFDVKIDPHIIKTMGSNFTISFVIDSYKEGYAWITVYFIPYDSDSLIPSHNYEKGKILTKGETEENTIYINVATPIKPGKFEVCIKIDDKSFFGINKYDECPSNLEVR